MSAVRVDAHHHVWGPEAAEYPWTVGRLAPMGVAHPLEELLPLLAACGIDHTVVVESSLTVEESPGLLALAACSDVVAGVVPWVELAAPDAAEVLAWLRGLSGGESSSGSATPT